MTDSGAGLRDVAEGFLVVLTTESFAVRALLGTVIALLLTALIIRFDLLRSARARRALYGTPLVALAAAAVASIGDEFLPSVLVFGGGTDSIVVFGEEVAVRPLGIVLALYGVGAAVCLLRRVAAHVVVAGLVRRAHPVDDPALRATAARLASAMSIDRPDLYLLERCPGGALTAGLRRPVVVLDPALLRRLDERELEGLVAHELAHIRRRDVLMNLLVGIARDLTFFLPTLHVACRWLRLEQEHGADEVAAAQTRRPAALASSILKVWDSTDARPRNAAMACATMAAQLSPLGRSGGVDLPGVRGPARTIAVRVLRLIQGRPVSIRRQRFEVAAAAAVVATAAMLPAVIGSWAGHAYSFGSVPFPELVVAEAPAFATFRALTDGASAGADDIVARTTTSCDDGCVLIETPAQRRAGVAPHPPVRTEGWGGEFVWEDAPLDTGSVAPEAEPLLGFEARGARFGFFQITEV